MQYVCSTKGIRVSSTKTKPITLRFEKAHLDLLKEKEGFDSDSKAINFLLAKYYWSHMLNPAAPVSNALAGDVKTGNGKALADMPKFESPQIALYKSYCDRLKDAQSVGEIEEINEEIQKSDLDRQQKKELQFMAQGLSRKID